MNYTTFRDENQIFFNRNGGKNIPLFLEDGISFWFRNSHKAIFHFDKNIEGSLFLFSSNCNEEISNLTIEKILIDWMNFYLSSKDFLY